MDIAKAELKKGVHEIAANDGFIESLRSALVIDARMRAIASQVENFGKGLALLNPGAGSLDAQNYRLSTRQLSNPIPGMLGKMEAERLHEKNPEIAKYFDGLKSDPAYSKKGQSWDVAPTHHADGSGSITAWCAAFVNWCLTQAGVPRLGFATARSWLDFGTPVAYPVYGCITVTKPSSSTGSTTGHVAFYVEHQGTKVKLLGGNQVKGTRVSETTYPEKWVVGYRWPTKINHYLLAGSSGVPV
jgi:uncharacterized protein (TIGR02594 family)